MIFTQDDSSTDKKNVEDEDIRGHTADALAWEAEEGRDKLR